MDEKKAAIILGALLHDIGKFMQRAEVPCRYIYDEREMQRVCKYNEKGNYFSHKHCLWTADFFETYQSKLPSLPYSFDNPDDTLANFAAKHHNPHTPLQWLIAEADRLSSGMDRLPKDEEDDGRKRDSFRRIRLYPILEEVDLNKTPKEKINQRIELNKLSLDKATVFPVGMKMLSPKEGDLLVQRYNDLWQEFIDEFLLIPKENPLTFIHTLLFLMEKYTWCIPSSTMDLPDISLFDHLKTTAATAACLYDYHNFDNTLEEKYIRNRYSAKYFLVCGDISGIQKFIYNITAKGAAKGLKGRSFLLQLLMDAAGKYILRQLNYPLTNQLYASGGKFYLLISNRHGEALKNIGDHINFHLLKKYNGELFLALGWCPLKGSDFLGANFPPKWQEASKETSKQKKMKFYRFDYKDVFGPFGIGASEKTCVICKKEGDLKSHKQENSEDKICPDCEDAERLGARLSRADYLVEVFSEQMASDDHGFDISFLKTKYYLEKDISSLNTSVLQQKNVCVYRLNSTAFLNHQSFNVAPHAYGFKFVGGTYLPQNGSGIPLTFNELAEKSTGLKRLGILRMDVDNLGRIFTRGFGNSASISRISTLSRSLSLFFGGYLNTISCQNKYKDYTSIIYSGGDDLFIVGAWNRIIDLGEEINAEFKQYAGNNPAFTLSGGVAMTAKKYPVYRGAKHAGDAERKSKELKRKEGKEKDAYTFFNKALSWDDFTLARDIKDLLYNGIVNGRPSEKGTDSVRLSKGLLDRLKRIYLLYEINKTYWQGKKDLTLDLIRDRLRYHKWVWRSVYSLNKAVKENSLFQDDLQIVRTALLENCLKGRQAEEEIIEFIDIPIRWVEFLMREEV